MSAAATAAGYLYASGRLRGRNGREEEGQDPGERAKPKRKEGKEGKEVKVAVYEPAPQAAARPAQAPKSPPKIQYRTRRWKPE